MTTEKAIVSTTPISPEIIEQVVVGGDLSKLTPQQRVVYYKSVCESLGLNPLTKPFSYLHLNGKLVLYALRDATDQLRAKHRISITIPSRETINDVFVVTARATTPDGRTDESTGAVTLGTLKGDALANAMMKAETKAKRRVTLSIVGLGWLDETELSTIQDAAPVAVDPMTGELPSEGLVAPVPPPANVTSAQPRPSGKLDEVQRFFALAKGLGYEPAKALMALKVKSVNEIPDPQKALEELAQLAGKPVPQWGS